LNGDKTIVKKFISTWDLREFLKNI